MNCEEKFVRDNDDSVTNMAFYSFTTFLTTTPASVVTLTKYIPACKWEIFIDMRFLDLRFET
jgi:hypothetical protein